MPASRHMSSWRRAPATSVVPTVAFVPKVMVPSASDETRRPERPSWRYSMTEPWHDALSNGTLRYKWRFSGERLQHPAPNPGDPGRQPHQAVARPGEELAVVLEDQVQRARAERVERRRGPAGAPLGRKTGRVGQRGGVQERELGPLAELRRERVGGVADQHQRRGRRAPAARPPPGRRSRRPRPPPGSRPPPKSNEQLKNLSPSTGSS